MRRFNVSSGCLVATTQADSGHVIIDASGSAWVGGVVAGARVSVSTGQHLWMDGGAHINADALAAYSAGQPTAGNLNHVASAYGAATGDEGNAQPYGDPLRPDLPGSACVAAAV